MFNIELKEVMSLPLVRNKEPATEHVLVSVTPLELLMVKLLHEAGNHVPEI